MSLPPPLLINSLAMPDLQGNTSQHTHQPLSHHNIAGSHPVNRRLHHQYLIFHFIPELNVPPPQHCSLIHDRNKSWVKLVIPRDKKYFCKINVCNLSKVKWSAARNIPNYLTAMRINHRVYSSVIIVIFSLFNFTFTLPVGLRVKKASILYCVFILLFCLCKLSKL